MTVLYDVVPPPEDSVVLHADVAGLDLTAPGPVLLLTAALQQLRELNPAELPPQTALLVASALVSAQDQVQALALRSVADVHTRDLYALDGNGSTGSWVADQQTSMSRSSVTLARRLEAFPQLADRVTAGGISVDDAAQVAKALSRLRSHVDRPDGLIDGQPGEEALYGVIVNGVCQLVGEARAGLASDHPLIVDLRARLGAIVAAPLPDLTRLEAGFLLLAARLPESRMLRPALGQLVDALLPNQLAERSDDRHRNRGLELTHDEHTGYHVRGALDDECGELLRTCLTVVMDTDPDNPTDTALAQQLRESGEPMDLLDPQARGCARPRSRSQRRHDALKLMLRKVIDSKALGTRNKMPVQVGVTISDAALHDRPGALPARTGNGAVVPATLVRQWLCDSVLTRFVLSLGHRVVESSHSRRTLTPHERRIKLLETGGTCQAAGCARGSPTGHPLVPHHVEPYARGGSTSLADTVLLCEIAHDDLHVGGKTLRLKDGRWISEAGWTDGPAR